MRQLSIKAGVLAIASCFITLSAQEPRQGGRGDFAAMPRVTGTITGVAGDNITVKAEDGNVYTVNTTANTRIMKGLGGPGGGFGAGGGGAQATAIKVSELKAGDGLAATGNMDAPNKTLHAMFVIATDAEQVKKLRENLGKTYISGKVTAIDADNLKLTVMRADGVSQTIGFDETTSFKRGTRGGRGGGGSFSTSPGAPPATPPAGAGGESITLADIKVGDNVVGQGAVKSGTFVPGTLMVLTPRPPRADRAPTDAAPAKPQ